MTPRTIFLSRLIGLYCLLVVGSLGLHRQAAVDTVSALLHNLPLMWLASIITLLGGLALVLAHNRWSSGAPAAIVTLVGWAALLKGLFFLLLPAGAGTEFILKVFGIPQLFYVCLAPSFAIGLYLTYAGFTAKLRS
jgi:heme/copper-type cytochrome/quinol oxidase subunit 3